ncbi:MAG: hypothetical protein ABFD54_09765 [Armatimonadota bacterium]|nr:type II secretion system GspH family protein [bacterium]
MIMLKRRQGTTLVDLMVTIFLLGTAAMIFSATFPSSFRASRQAKDNKIATAIAQRKMEELRALRYESLTYNGLLTAQIIDDTPMSSPYSFTIQDNLASQLTSGTGTIEISDSSSGTDLKRLKVTVSWEGADSSRNRTMSMTTYFVDKRPRRVY